MQALLEVQNTLNYWRRVSFHTAWKQSSSFNERQSLSDLCNSREWGKLSHQPRDLVPVWRKWTRKVKTMVLQDRRTMCNNNKACSHTHCCCGKAISIKHSESVCIIILMQSACTILYCRPWPVWLCHIFPHYLTNSTIFGRNYRTLNVCFDFLYNLSETFLSLKNSVRYYQKRTQVFTRSTQ
jgi:hypothetical protein